MRAPYRSVFTPDAIFRTRRSATIGGMTFDANEASEELQTVLQALEPRRLRQLFDQRVVIYADEVSPGSILPPEQIGFVQNDPDPASTETEAEAAEREAAEAEAARRAVEIPDDWAGLKWPALLSLAASVSPDKIHNKAEAVAAVEAELSIRAQLS